MSPAYTLVSHALCPYVQRVAIVLAEKGVAFTRRDVDLLHKPGWFRAISPLGKTPVLLVGDVPLFESTPICEYLDETLDGTPAGAAAPRLHPADPLERARHRAWMAFGSSVLDAIGGLYAAPDAAGLGAAAAVLRGRFEQVEAVLAGGPWFGGAAFGLVDAVFAPAFRYFEVIDAVPGFDAAPLWHGLPRVLAWRQALMGRASVAAAVEARYPTLLAAFLAGRDSELGRLARAATAVAPTLSEAAA